MMPAVTAIHPTDDHGYFRRGGVELSRVEGINPNIVDALRGIKSVLVIEMQDEASAASYQVAVELVPFHD